MEKKMETTIMENQTEKKMENDMDTREYMGAIVLGLCRDHGKENGNYYSILVLYTDNGKEHGKDYVVAVYTGLVQTPEDGGHFRL